MKSKKKRKYETDMSIPTTPEKLAEAVLKTLTDEEMEEIKKGAHSL